MQAVLLFATACLGSVLAHPNYRDALPNGYNVPNPCGGGIWEAVGHFDPIHHTHTKNVFGMAFASAGRTWTSALCMADSDGDGMSNGEELGDASCTWSRGSMVAGPAKGHPGICEPVGSTQCSSQGFACGCHGHNCVGK